MARALLVGCGCRGRELGKSLLEEGWRVRGTTRARGRLGEIDDAGIEAVVADPDIAATILDQVADVTVVAWLLGSAHGEPRPTAAIHGPRLEHLLERLVETPVRGFLYEARGSVEANRLQTGGELVRAAGRRWRIPVELLDEDPGDWRSWVSAAAAAVQRLAGGE